MAQVTSNIVPSGLLGGFNKPAPAGGLSGAYNAQTGGFGPTPNMSTPMGPRYSPPPSLGSLGSTPVVKHTINADGSQSVTHAQPTSQKDTKNSSAGQTPPVSSAPQPQFSGIMGAGTGSIIPSGGIIDTKTGQPQAPSGSADAGQTGTTGTTGGQTPSNVPPPTDTSPQGLLQHLTQFGQQDPGLNDLYQQQQQLERRFADMTGNILNTPGDLNYQTGRLAALQSEYNTAKANLANTYQSRLAARGQQIGAVQGAAGLIPQALLYKAFGAGGQTGGTQTGGTSTSGAPGLTYDFQTDSNNMAQAVIDGSMTYQQALDSLGYQGNISTGNLNSAIKAKGGNPLELQAQGPAQQQAIGNYSGTLLPAYTASQGVKKTLDQFISDNPAINTTQLTAGNALQQWLQGKQLGDPNVQTFLDDVSEYVQTLAPILGVGGTPTDAKAYTASQFVNAQASGESVQQVLSNIETLAQNKLNYYKAGATGATPPSITPQTSGGTGGTTGSTSTGDFAETW